MSKRHSRFATWHVVSDEVGTVLGVYGSALLSQAQELARSIESHTGLPTYVHSIAGKRPSVGQSISMRGVHVRGARA